MDIHGLKQFESVYQPSKEIAFCWLRKQYVQLSTEENHSEVVDHANDSLRIWQAAKAHETKKLEGCVVVPVELSESIAEKLALEKVEKPRQENDVVWQEIADRSYKDHLIQKKWEIIRNYKELVEAARGGNE